MNKTQKTTLNTKNSKILHETMVTIGALKEGSAALEEMEIDEIQVHLLDEDGDGVVLCLEHDERTGELKKTFHTMEEYYTDDEEETDDELMVALEDTTGDYDPCISPENIKEVLDTMIEKTISEEYDEVFQEYDKDGKPPLLN